MSEAKKIVLSGCTMTVDELLKARRDAILESAARHGAHNVRVFGSVARGEADVVSERGLKPRMRRRVLQEAVAL